MAENEKIMVSRSLSKSYALAGLRFGFLVAQPQIIEQLVKVKDSYNCDALSIAGATAAIDDQAWLADNRAKILATPAAADRRHAAAGFRQPSIRRLTLSGTRIRRLPVRPLYERLKAERILVRYMDYAGWGDGLRISVGTRRADRRLSGGCCTDDLMRVDVESIRKSARPLPESACERCSMRRSTHPIPRQSLGMHH